MANQVAWIGQDGNLWVKGTEGTQNWGSAGGYEFTSGGVRSLGGNPLAEGAGFAPGVDQIADPLAPKPVATGTGGGTKPKVLNQAAVDATQQAINSLDTELSVGNKNIDDSLNSVTSRYDQEAGKAQADFDENTVTNNTNLQKNKQNALISAAQGRRGLRGTLASIGALSGDGGKMADRVVTQGANEDIGEATDTAASNATTLTKAKTNFDDEDKQRRAEAQTSATNSRTALEGQVLSKRQQFFQKMAELFGEADNTAAAGNWLNQAGALNTPIAEKSAVQASPITARSAAFTPGELESYLAGAGDMTVEVAPGDGTGEGKTSILAARKKKEERELATA